MQMSILREMFAWWTGNTIGMRVFTALHGRSIGEDGLGNRYYEQRKGNGPLGRPRRWVIYQNIAEASLVPPEWHGWLHYTVNEPPTQQNIQTRPWQQRHQPNLTGTPHAYRPPGSILTQEDRPSATGDYDAWTPD